MWHLVVYATLFHFTRQFFGIFRWYIFKEKVSKNISNFLFYSLMVLPLLVLHFRTNIEVIGYYTANDIFSYPNEQLFMISSILNAIAVLYWIFCEYRINKVSASKNSMFTPRFLYMLSTIILFNMVAYFASNSLELIVPLVSAHGLQYYLLNGKIMIDFHKMNIKKVFIFTILVGVYFGFINDIAENMVELNDSYLNVVNQSDIVLVALVLTPLFGHYILDMFMWTSNYFKKLSKFTN